MYTIGILSRPGRTLVMARTEIHKNFSFEARSYTNAFRAAQGLKAKEYDALVMIADEFGTTQAEIVHQIKKRFPELPLVVVADVSDQDLKQRVSEYKKALVLDAKTEMADIPGVLYKMLHNLPVIVRGNNRHKTSQQASLLNSDKKSIHPSWLFNLGKSGAQLRVFGKNLRAGEKINLKIYLPELKKEREIVGEVVWVAEDKAALKNKNSQMVGVRFS